MTWASRPCVVREEIQRLAIADFGCNQHRRPLQLLVMLFGRKQIIALALGLLVLFAGRQVQAAE